MKIKLIDNLLCILFEGEFSAKKLNEAVKEVQRFEQKNSFVINVSIVIPVFNGETFETP